jgi:hypothetical protein
VLVEKRRPGSIVYGPVAETAGSGYGIGPQDWGHTLERFREDLATVVTGDRAHVFVPESEVYILEVARNEYKASGKGWVAWRTGQSPTRAFSDQGLFFDPASEWNLDGELVYRPFHMLEDGAHIVDSQNRQWRFTAPFRFVDERNQPGSPAWPLVVAGDDQGTKVLNGTSEDHEKAEWSARSGVDSNVFDLELPDW